MGTPRPEWALVTTAATLEEAATRITNAVDDLRAGATASALLEAGFTTTLGALATVAIFNHVIATLGQNEDLETHTLTLALAVLDHPDPRAAAA